MPNPKSEIRNPKLLLRSLTYHWRMNLAVAVGVLAGTAVLTGALLVGDSVRGSLQHLALDGLGRINHVLVTDKFFRTALPEHLQQPAAEAKVETLPAVFLQGTVSAPNSTGEGSLRANRVTILGCDSFAKLRVSAADAPLATKLGTDEIVLNAPLAAGLQAKAGSEVIVRLPTPSDIPRDSPLGRKTESLSSARFTVKAVIPAEGLGRFSLHPNQVTALNAYVSIEALQRALRQEGKANALLAAGETASASPLVAKELNTALRPMLDDLGLFARETDKKYLLFGSKHMLLEPAAEQSALKIASDAKLSAQPTLTYLANYITCGPNDKGKIPYSTITALDVAADPPLGPLVKLDGQPLPEIGEDQIVLNEWAYKDFADQGVNLQPGDEVRITFFEPESTHGNVKERTVTLKLHAVVKLDGVAADRDFTPELKGVTDEDSIADWNPPFPYDPKRVRSTKPNDIDEQYWDQHRATPKAFVSLATGRKLWASRFGQTTAIRVAPGYGTVVENLASRWQESVDTAAMGFAFRPVRYQANAAATGTTPFNLLFLGFSMFIIAAAVMLVALLFRLSVERRAREVGILLATGWSQRQVRRLLLGEGLIIASLGGLAGVAAGVGYAWLMLAGLRTWWVAAVSAPFLELHWTGLSLAIGYLCGVGVSLAAVAWALRNMRGATARQLLAGNTADEARTVTCRGGSVYVAWVSLLGAAALSALAVKLNGEAQAGAFFGAGALVLVALLSIVWRRLVMGSTLSLVAIGQRPILRLAVRNAARHPSRSTLTIALVASAAFLIVAISAFHVDPPESFEQKNSGTGGFSLQAESSAPVLLDLNDPDARFDMGFTDIDEKLLKGCTFYALRNQPGDDASCLNLYQPQQPRVLGITRQVIERGGFDWAGSAATTDTEKKNPWLLLDRKLEKSVDDSEPVPVIIDAATAMFSLHLSGVGARLTITDGRGQPLTLEVVGLLKNSLFQGRLLVSESQFLEHFPDTEGYGFFLISTPIDRVRLVGSRVADVMGDFGLWVRPTTEVLAEFMAVQNTYLSTFQSLGGLGLLLGTLGLATVQLRNVLERRGELALLRATGFRQSLLARLVFYENASLLIGGLAVGALAAVLAILPHLYSGGATIPWSSLILTLGLVAIVGLVAGLIAVRAVLRTPLLDALRGE